MAKQGMTDADSPSKQDIAKRSWHAMAPGDAVSERN
jgi:hypothetical protein